MTILQQTLTDYQVLQQRLDSQLNGWDPADLLPAQVAMQSQSLNAQQISEKLQAMTNASGWLLFPSTLLTLPTDDPALLTASYPLSGELKINDQHIRLSYVGSGEWHWSTGSVSWVEADEATHLLERVIHQATSPALEAVNYWRVWALNDNAEIVKQGALFDGFKGDIT